MGHHPIHSPSFPSHSTRFLGPSYNLNFYLDYLEQVFDTVGKSSTRLEKIEEILYKSGPIDFDQIKSITRPSQLQSVYDVLLELDDDGREALAKEIAETASC